MTCPFCDKVFIGPFKEATSEAHYFSCRASQKPSLSSRIRKLHAGYQGMDDQGDIAYEVEYLEEELKELKRNNKGNL